MFPYIHAPDTQIPIPGIGKLPLHPFGVLVATGVMVGTWLAVRRARARGVDLDKLNSFITWMLAFGFAGGHIFDQIFYHPKEIFENPLVLLMLWKGLSSFGGFLGALIGVVLWKYFYAVPIFETPIGALYKYKRRPEAQPIMPLCDLITAVFPVAWIFGRTGCTVVHDHPGALTDSILGVGYPYASPHQHPAGASFKLIYGQFHRFDLGLLEMLFTVVVAIAFALTWRKRLPTGSYIVAAAFSYGPVRFVMDYYRLPEAATDENADLRYGSLTFAQWSCLALVAFGIYMITVIRKNAAAGIDPMDKLLVSNEPPAAPPPEDPAPAAT